MPILPRIAVVLLLAAGAVRGGPSVHGRVSDEATGRPLSGVVVRIGPAATVTDSVGHFLLRVTDDASRVVFTLMGHRPRRLALPVDTGEPLLVALERQVIRLQEEVVIYGRRQAPHGQVHKAPSSTDAIIEALPGVASVRRANFALEPTIRGATPDRVGVVIDGMRVFSACVDRMDPVTSYVETENLQRLEVSRGGFDLTQGQAVGGVINLVTEPPSLTPGLTASAQVGYESVSRHRYSRNVVNYGGHDLAVRGSFSWRKADDFAPGGRRALSNTQFSKANYKLDLTKHRGRHKVTVGLLGDVANDIGYPALLMDATRARARLASLDHVWTTAAGALTNVQTRVYANSVDHWMDDDHRDVRQREVMRDMHMPMFGRTRTMGLLQKLTFAGRRQTWEIVLDAYRLTSFADMEMLSIHADVAPMYLVNVGDVVREHVALTTNHGRILSETLQWRTNLRLDLARQDVRHAMARRQLSATWGTADLDRGFQTWSLSTVLQYNWRQHTVLSLGLADTARLPTHVESYGFYMFDPTDGYFHTGQPRLDAEGSRQIELGVEHEVAGNHLGTRVFLSRIRNAIRGVIEESVFKTYRNTGQATLYGAEAEVALRLHYGLQMQGTASYVHGQDHGLDEPLPLMPPLEGRIDLSRQFGRSRLGLGTRLVGRQTRTARQASLEQETPGFALVDARIEMDLTGQRRLRVAVDNLLDRYYYEHLSVGNLPSPGRNIRMELQMGL